ncbi:MAG: ATP-binding protein [archaeon]
MYLSEQDCLKLDDIIKSFEVGYRSYVADVIMDNISSPNVFLKELEIMKDNFENNSIITSEKSKSKLFKYINEYDNLFSKINYSYISFQNGDYDSEKVMSVTEMLDIILLLFNSYFTDILHNFETVEQFIYFSRQFQKTRNSLSHPASSKILIKESKEVITYINKIIDYLRDKYFWYIPKAEISNKIREFINNVKNIPIKIHNLDSIPFKHEKIIMREQELSKLNKYIFGESINDRIAGSVVIYGYGGVGKTALVLEFIYESFKNINDNKVNKDINFILFFTGKEEEIKIEETTGKLYLEEISQQINSFENFYKKLKKIFKKNNNHKNKGLIIIDNFEIFSDDDKEKIIKFIKKSPRSVQYILTSRNEENCEEKLHISGFDKNESGIKFIDRYCEENDLKINLTNKEKIDLINASVGNTLILILALQRLDDNKIGIKKIIEELENNSAVNSELIVKFMYKNTFDQTIKELRNEDFKPAKLLKIIALYNEPVDVASLSSLTEYNPREVEYLCDKLCSKLILNKTKELYTLNEFASKFIYVKFIPEKIELYDLKEEIAQHKIEIKRKLSNLEKKREESKQLDEIMKDYKPKNYNDKIAIAEAFDLYGKAKWIERKVKDIGLNEIKKTINEIQKTFEELELRSGHPYIRVQKARIYKMLFDAKVNVPNYNKKELKEEIKNYYEETIYTIEFEYEYIKYTHSYACVLWLFGLFLNRYYNDYSNAIKHLEKSKKIFEEIEVLNDNYIKMLAELKNSYEAQYKKTNNYKYREANKDIHQLMKSMNR